MDGLYYADERHSIIKTPSGLSEAPVTAGIHRVAERTMVCGASNHFIFMTGVLNRISEGSSVSECLSVIMSSGQGIVLFTWRKNILKKSQSVSCGLPNNTFTDFLQHSASHLASSVRATWVHVLLTASWERSALRSQIRLCICLIWLLHGSLFMSGLACRSDGAEAQCCT